MLVKSGRMQPASPETHRAISILAVVPLREGAILSWVCEEILFINGAQAFACLADAGFLCLLSGKHSQLIQLTGVVTD